MTTRRGFFGALTGVAAAAVGLRAPAVTLQPVREEWTVPEREPVHVTLR